MRSTFLYFLLLLMGSTLTGQIRLPRLLSDGAILQRDTDLTLWGWAAPDERVTLEFNGTRYRTRAGADGKWTIKLPAQPAGGPFEMVFRGSNTVTLADVLFGDVWLCSGQSNMELALDRVADEYPEIVTGYTNNRIRQFLVPDRYDFNRAHDDLTAGNWEAARPENLPEFTAVGFFFAREIYEREQVPIGLINAALGGSPVESWMSEAALKRFPEAYTEMLKFRDTVMVAELEARERAAQAGWLQQLNASDAGLQSTARWSAANIDESNWREMQVPGYWADQGTGLLNGSVWLRRRVEVPDAMAGREARLWLGRVVDQDSVWLNGTFIGTTGYQYPPRKYTVPTGVLKAGGNTLAVRVINGGGKGGFVPDKPYFLAVEGVDTLDLRGTWKYRIGAPMDPQPGTTFVRWKAGGLFNRMIAPLREYPLRGVLWYQGESNTGNPEGYAHTFPALISDWRDQWNDPDLPFLFVQLTNFMDPTPRPTESNWAQLRQAQLEALALPHTGMAMAIDVGEWNDIHPLDKESVGHRLALAARRVAYGDTESPISPYPTETTFAPGEVRITLAGTDQLTVKNGDDRPRYFEISGDGDRFVRASARLEGNTVIVSSPEVPQPVAVRYAWADNPTGANLYSAEGLPVSPFEVRKEEQR
ncbi:sialate O-acetylesterase [Neolewinella litorea]|uniref:Sialate O-acetylesterase n=1 Tax=Neolewinella litorea TaxID=2562452 RepID=A0A4S4NCR1_9BACT|nr:sialate O-acetylesterase [Neolewinella litorea]THH36535.1 sialate O-acetylesterase [Neolewinella litorea]